VLRSSRLAYENVLRKIEGGKGRLWVATSSRAALDGL